MFILRVVEEWEEVVTSIVFGEFEENTAPLKYVGGVPSEIHQIR